MNNFSLDRLFIPILTVGGLLIALLMGNWVASGRMLMPGLVIGAIFGAIFFLKLGRMYWYMIPFTLASGLPAIPLGGRTVELGELAVAVCTAIFVARVALQKDRLVLFRMSHIPLLLGFAWICMVWALNPTGFLFLGSDIMGGRYYLKIVLAFCAFVVLASQEPTEKDFLRIIYLVFFGVILKVAYGMFSYFVLGGAEVGDPATQNIGEGEYSWHQILAGPAIIGTYYLFARYKTSEIFGFQRPLAVCFYLGALVLAMLSGKRMGLLLVMSTPFLCALVYREYKHILLGGALGLLGVGILTMGQGQIFTLPFTAQRALSWLPGDWDPSLRTLGSSDTFRAELRTIAVDKISKSPLIGKGYANSISDVITGYNMLEHGSGLELEKVMGHAMSSNWHNAWLGYSADFGIPFTVLYVWLLATALFLSVRMARNLPHPSTRQIFCVYAFYSIFAKVLSIHTSGHTAVDAFGMWWLYGLVFAVAAQVSREIRMEKYARSQVDVLPGKASISIFPKYQ